MISPAVCVGVDAVGPAMQVGAAEARCRRARSAGPAAVAEARALLGDEGRRAEKPRRSDLLQPELVNEQEDVAGHIRHVVRHDPGRGADAAVGEQDDFAIPARRGQPASGPRRSRSCRGGVRERPGTRDGCSSARARSDGPDHYGDALETVIGSAQPALALGGDDADQTLRVIGRESRPPPLGQRPEADAASLDKGILGGSPPTEDSGRSVLLSRGRSASRAAGATPRRLVPGSRTSTAARAVIHVPGPDDQLTIVHALLDHRRATPGRPSRRSSSMATPSGSTSTVNHRHRPPPTRHASAPPAASGRGGRRRLDPVDQITS